MSCWLFDLGNTRLKYAPLGDDGRIGAVRAVAHDGVRFEAGLAAVLPARFDEACIASVASIDLRVRLLDALASHCARLSLACTRRHFDGMSIAYEHPGHLGVDRFLALVGAHACGG